MSAEFVACMEDVLDLYAEPYDPERPAVCFDETSKQLLAWKLSNTMDTGFCVAALGAGYPGQHGR